MKALNTNIMPDAQPKVPEQLTKKGPEKKAAKIDSPETANALAKEAGHKMIDSYMANGPKPREGWDDQPKDSERSKNKKKPEEKPKQPPSGKPQPREDW